MGYPKKPLTFSKTADNLFTVMNNKELITKLLWLFESQKFTDWHADGGQFGRYITGDLQHEDVLSHQECVKIIRRDIARFLQIEDEA